MEIERKFLVRCLPAGWESFPRRRIAQCYLCEKPVLRVRRDGDTYCLTYKGPGLLAREEHEFPLTEEAYRHLSAKADGLTVEKDRVLIPLKGHTVELDLFHPPLSPLMLAEVEFSTVAEAESFQPPDWFGEEVTHDPAYANVALSRRGLP